MNHLSDYGSVEMNAEILDHEFTAQFEKLLRNIIKKDCRHVTFEDHTKRKTWLFRVIDWFSYQMIRFMMRLMFAMAPKKSKPKTV